MIKNCQSNFEALEQILKMVELKVESNFETFEQILKVVELKVDSNFEDGNNF